MSSLRSKKILVVDDEKDLREAIRFELEMVDAEVSEAAGGHEAFERLKSHSFDLVLSDVRMPQGDGMELLDRIKERDAWNPVVLFVTGFSDLSVAQIYDRGVSGCISKPFDPECLVTSILRALKVGKEGWIEPINKVPTNFQTTVHQADLTRTTFEKTFTLGRGGMFISTLGPFPEVKDLIRFKVILNKVANPIDGYGVVRWKRDSSTDNQPAGYGIEFFGLQVDVANQFEELIRGLKNQIPFIPAQ